MDEDELRRVSQPRLAVLEAIVKAQSDLPALLAIAMDSADSAAAQAAVADHFAVSPQEAGAILDMPVRRMSKAERAKIVAERDALARWLQE